MNRRVVVGMGTCGLSAGAQASYDALMELAEGSGFPVSITGCIGMCFREPIIEVRDDSGRTVYGDVTPERAREIWKRHVLGGEPVAEWTIRNWEASGAEGGTEAPFLARQRRIVLRNCGLIDPESIDEYEGTGGYSALRKALLEMTPGAVIEEVRASGLRGRGGAGFPPGQKWSFAAASPGPVKYIVCNADEGDPGAFMDRSVLESDPHSVLEGMIIAARAIGGTSGYIYCRAEYPLAIKRLTLAIEAAHARGYLGRNIMGSGLDFDLKI